MFGVKNMSLTNISTKTVGTLTYPSTAVNNGSSVSQINGRGLLIIDLYCSQALSANTVVITTSIVPSAQYARGMCITRSGTAIPVSISHNGEVAIQTALSGTNQYVQGQIVFDV